MSDYKELTVFSSDPIISAECEIDDSSKLKKTSKSRPNRHPKFTLDSMRDLVNKLGKESNPQFSFISYEGRKGRTTRIIKVRCEDETRKNEVKTCHLANICSGSNPFRRKGHFNANYATDDSIRDYVNTQGAKHSPPFKFVSRAPNNERHIRVTIQDESGMQATVNISLMKYVEQKDIFTRKSIYNKKVLDQDIQNLSKILNFTFIEFVPSEQFNSCSKKRIKIISNEGRKKGIVREVTVSTLKAKAKKIRLNAI